MSIKEIITYLLLIVGLVMVCIGKVKFQKRQQTIPDNMYSKEEKMLVKGGYGVLAIAFILAAIPIY